MRDWVERYIAYRFPVIPLGRGSKTPAASGWVQNRYPASAFQSGNVGTRAGEWIDVGGKAGYLLIIDFDSPDVRILRQLCAEIPLARTTCVRTGGVHRGYHLYYLTGFETRKRGLLAYRDASIDLLGKGSFAVIPPSIVEMPYRYLIGLDELSFLSRDAYEALLSLLSRWKWINTTIKYVTEGKLADDKAREQFDQQGVLSEMIDYYDTAIG